MHEVRLVGVHEDGERLLLTDADGGRYELPVDDALRAAVRRDRAHLGQLQIEIEGGLRPRDVQARIRAGASAEEVAALAGWTVEKVRRYEGPVLAEREHVAGLARAVRVRRRGVEPVALGTLVARRLAARGVDPDRVGWDAWRPDQGPWVLAALFVAGGRERQAQWHFDPAAGSIAAADDEARWLSDDEPADQPLGAGSAGRLSAVRAGDGVEPGSVYDIEADGGVGAEPRRSVDSGVPTGRGAGAGVATGGGSSRAGGATGPSGGGDQRGAESPLDLVSAMRSRRRSREAAPRTGGAGRRRGPDGHPGQVASTGSQPSDVPGSNGSTHPAGRRRPPEPLELDPSLMDDPPAAHPRSSGGVPEITVDDAALGAETAGDVGLPEAPDEAAGAVGRLADPDDQLATDPPPASPPTDAPTAAPTSKPRAKPAVKTAAKAPARARRTSVPTWDDIMFGAKRD